MPTQQENDDVKLHLQEADNLKKQWYSHVFNSISTLAEKIEANTLQIQREKEELLKLLISHRDKLLEAIQDNDTKHKEDFESLRKNIDIIIEAIKDKLGSVTHENSEIRLLVETELNALKEEFRDNLQVTLKVHIDADEKKFSKLDERLEQLESDMGKYNTVQATLKTKIGVYAVVMTVIITAIVSVITGGAMTVFKDLIKVLLSGTGAS